MAEKVLRCAVYTRKSTEDGLEQEFNSLDAQYDACAAYALSQKHEGWTLVPERYDDGGFSGGNMQRPGLTRLLADVAAGKVQVILIYKIDRLTRSLADFAKIVEVLDKANASFVSITQSFNTTTSMGRLTLNMLLSFAQFEREVTGERIRDKIAASKRKGMWMGGPVPLGYDVVSRKLVVNKAEAALVRHIFERYLALGSVAELADELNRDGYRTKVQKRRNGEHRGGRPFTRGMLYHFLANRIYMGELTTGGEHYPGEHEAIVEPKVWHAVQELIRANTVGTSRRLKAREPSLLTGLVVDGEGRAMTPSHAAKPGKRYRYYVTRPDVSRGSPAWRLPADDLETLVSNRIAGLLCDRHQLLDLAGDMPANLIKRLLARSDTSAAKLRSGSAHEKLDVLARVIEQINVREDAVEIVISLGGLFDLLEVEPGQLHRGKTLTLALPATKVRRGPQLRLVLGGADGAGQDDCARDEKLVGLVGQAMEAMDLVLAQPDKPITQIAAHHGRCRKRLGKLVAISCLAPDIVAAILQGQQPRALTAQKLFDTDLPLRWDEQRQVLGFA